MGLHGIGVYLLMDLQTAYIPVVIIQRVLLVKKFAECDAFSIHFS